MVENTLSDVGGKVVLIGKRAIVKVGKDRYIIYLPTPLNKLWSNLNVRKRKVLVYLELPAD